MTYYRALSKYDKENLWLAVVAVGALAGLALTWWWAA